MPKQFNPDGMDALVSLISESPTGIPAVSLRELVPFEGSDKSLLRRLNRLLQEERIRKKGQGRGTLYFPVKEVSTAATTDFDYLSEEGLKIRQKLSRPASLRKPVGYQLNLLVSYQPNQTWYLPEFTRLELMEMGQVEKGKLPAGTYLRQVMDRLIIDLSWNSSPSKFLIKLKKHLTASLRKRKRCEIRLSSPFLSWFIYLTFSPLMM
jgi:hypothetical protein